MGNAIAPHLDLELRGARSRRGATPCSPPEPCSRHRQNLRRRAHSKHRLERRLPVFECCRGDARAVVANLNPASGLESNLNPGRWPAIASSTELSTIRRPGDEPAWPSSRCTCPAGDAQPRCLKESMSERRNGDPLPRSDRKAPAARSSGPTVLVRFVGPCEWRRRRSANPASRRMMQLVLAQSHKS